MSDKHGHPDRPDPRVLEDAAEGPHERMDSPETPPETGPIEKGRVDAGPTGERRGGYREVEPPSHIARIGLVALGVILAVLIIAFVVVR